ncbi:hypothetical protein [Pelosinus fermentans]|uniref:Outer membrane insertion C-terminal signal n=1 Tax=Pelosinus fermentans JBW45 TaxID=1192197 RepID=I9NJY7_9FIRM|nr:hypothetical protein [Pelosinus fermentans]AJQ25702.1 hypothetical protein JBW_00350 [Pelosinus fermentans JBW45]
MKKIILTVAAFFAFGIGTGFAAPMNNLANGQTAVGYLHDSFYIEHKLTNNLTLGLQEHDIYGQYAITNTIRAIIGSRDYHSDSSIYLGAAYSTSLAPNVNGYASLVGSSDFAEAQVGANVNVAPNVDINVDYTAFMPDHGSDRNRFGLGATFKF